MTPPNAFPFDFEVPRQLVAQEPLRHRADARLMVVDRHRQEILHHHVRDLPHLLPPATGWCLTTLRSFPAQLAGHPDNHRRPMAWAVYRGHARRPLEDPLQNPR